VLTAYAARRGAASGAWSAPDLERPVSRNTPPVRTADYHGIALRKDTHCGSISVALGRDGRLAGRSAPPAKPHEL